eukprot:COSAG02_NODE_34790_length_478_cov_0.815303_1_plen_59_part_10
MRANPIALRGCAGAPISRNVQGIPGMVCVGVCWQCRFALRAARAVLAYECYARVEAPDH